MAEDVCFPLITLAPPFQLPTLRSVTLLEPCSSNAAGMKILSRAPKAAIPKIRV